MCCFLEQETFTPQKVLVVPRNRWLRLNMTEKLFTGTLNHNQNKKQKIKTKQISGENPDHSTNITIWHCLEGIYHALKSNMVLRIRVL